MYDRDLYLQAGIKPPKKAYSCNTKKDTSLKDNIRKQLRVLDEQAAVNKFTWYNLPEGLDGKLIERILYYKGAGMFFKLDDRFYFLPYALDGGIDCYGRYKGVTPLPFNGSTETKDDKPLIKGLVYTPEYDVLLPEDFINDDGSVKMEELMDKIDHSCVIIRDYTEQRSQTNIPRQLLQDPLLDVMSECIPLMRTNLINGSGVQGLRVGDSSEYSNVIAANEQVLEAALEGQRYLPITAALDFQDLSTGNATRSEEYMLALQSMDNYRLSLHGLANGGLFRKKSHMLEAEQEMNMGNIGLIMRDCTQNRQGPCNVINSLWGLGMWCEPSEVVTNIDRTGDGVMGSDEEMTRQAVDTSVEEVVE